MHPKTKRRRKRSVLLASNHPRQGPYANTSNIPDLNICKLDYRIRRCRMELGLSLLSLTHKQTYVALVVTLAFRKPVPHGHRYGLCSLSWTSTKLPWCSKRELSQQGCAAKRHRPAHEASANPTSSLSPSERGSQTAGGESLSPLAACSEIPRSSPLSSGKRN